MLFLVVLYIFVTLCTDRIYGNNLAVEPIETTWRFANVICESSNYILLPGRSYRKSGLIKSLTVGQAVWLKGWRMVTENQPGDTGNIRFLKTDFIPSYNVMIRKYICEYDDGVFSVTDVPVRSPTDQTKAATSCQNNGGNLARIGRHDVKTVLDLIQIKVPHWSSVVTSDDSIAKQCLAAKRISSGIKYYYEDCERNLPFVCLQDETASVVFAPIVSKRYAPFKDFETEIAKIASRTTTKTTIEDTTMTQTTTEMTATTTVEETTVSSYNDEVTSPYSQTETNVATKETVTEPSSTTNTMLGNYTNEGEEQSPYMNNTTYSSVENAITTSVFEDESTPSINQTTKTSTFLTRVNYVTTTPDEMRITSESLAYEQDKVQNSSVVLSNNISTNSSASSEIVTDLSNLTQFFDNSYVTSFTSGASVFAGSSTTSSSRVLFQPYPTSHIVESSISTAEVSKGVMTPSTVKSSTGFSGKSQHISSTFIPLENSFQFVASLLPLSVSAYTLIKPSSSWVSHVNFQNSTSVFQSVMSDSVRVEYSDIWELSTEPTQTYTIFSSEKSVLDNIDESTDASAFETTLVIKELSKVIDVSKVLSELEYKADFTTSGAFINTGSDGIGSVTASSRSVEHLSATIQESFKGVTQSPPIKSLSVSDVSNTYSRQIQSRTLVMQSVSHSTKYITTMDKSLATSFTSHSKSYTISPSHATTPTTFTERIKHPVLSTAGPFTGNSLYDYYYDYPSEIPVFTGRVSSSHLYSKVISEPTPAINVSKPIHGHANSSSVKDTISPTKTIDIVMSEDIKSGSVDIESINRSSKDSPKQEPAAPMWIAIGVIGVATVISLVIALILYKRRRKQKTLADIRTNGTQHPLVNKQQRETQNEVFAPSQTSRNYKDKQKNSDQSRDIFVDEAYDL